MFIISVFLLFSLVSYLENIIMCNEGVITTEMNHNIKKKTEWMSSDYITQINLKEIRLISVYYYCC